jgi:hypothetical protein
MVAPPGRFAWSDRLSLAELIESVQSCGADCLGDRGHVVLAELREDGDGAVGVR